MGGILSKFRRSRTTVEVLEDIDKNILELEKCQKSNEAKLATNASNIFFVGGSIYVLYSFAVYYYYLPLRGKKYEILAWSFVLILPFILYGWYRFCRWRYNRNICYYAKHLKESREKQKEILENVMETEKYKVAKEILEKYDPATKRKLEEERKRAEQPFRQQMPSGQELRRRNNAAVAKPVNQQTMPAAARNNAQLQRAIPPTSAVSNGPNGNRVPPGGRPPLPRPLLNPSRSVFEKIVDRILGDGPENRFALICTNCFAHNGMIMQEEYEYFAWKCAYCGFFHQARKVKPVAPPLYGDRPKLANRPLSAVQAPMSPKPSLLTSSAVASSKPSSSVTLTSQASSTNTSSVNTSSSSGVANDVSPVSSDNETKTDEDQMKSDVKTTSSLSTTCQQLPNGSSHDENDNEIFSTSSVTDVNPPVIHQQDDAVQDCEEVKTGSKPNEGGGDFETTELKAESVENDEDKEMMDTD